MDAILFTISFSVIISVVFLTAFFLHIFGRGLKFVSIAPNLLTGLGVLGTFVGIFLGLLEFDVNKINESVPPLLDGMKTAFFTSIFGMFFGLVMRGVIAIIPQTKTGRSAKTQEDVMGMIGEIADGVKKNDENFDKIIKVISGDSDSSVATQLTKLRTDSNDNHKELVKALNSFAEEVAKNSTEAIVEALKKVVQDFNEQINEQFGENFKQLNEAVGRLLTWQENYKEELSRMQEQFQRCLDSIDKVERAMTSIKENTDAIPPAMEKLPEIVKTATDTLEAFAQMKDQAISAFPTIEENLGRLTTGLESQVQAFESALTAQQESYKQLENAFAGMGEKAENAIEQLSEKTQSAMTQLTEKTESVTQQLTEKTQEAVEGMSTGMQNAITTAMSEIQQGMQETIRQTNAELKENFTQFDEQMRQEITSALEEMGSNLASLSRRFVDDYAPLTEELQRLLAAVDVRNREQNNG